MKIQKLNHWAFLPLICLAATLITSCGGGGGGGGGIFAAVEDEVKLNKVSVPNVVKTMVVHGGNLYCTNAAKLFVKGLTSGTGWTAVDYSSRIALLASDASNLYVMTEDRKVFVWGGGDVTGYSGTAKVILDNQYIKNNSIAYREAFVVTDTGCFKLNGTTATLISGVSSETRGAIWNRNATVFVNTPCVTSNFDYTSYWTPDSPITSGSARPGTPALASVGNSVSTIFTTVWSKKDEPITTLAYSKESGTEYMLIGTKSSGYRKIQMSNGKQVDVHRNGNQFDTFPIAEDGIWVIPNGAETRAIYASVVSVSDTSRYGLWAWYPGSSGWNLD